MAELDVVQYFISDPFRILYLLGGAGGLWFWIEKWRDRTRMNVRLLSYSIDGFDRQPTAKIIIEVENLGTRSTSLAARGFALGYRNRRTMQFTSLDVLDPDRQLLPNAPRVFTIAGRVSPDYPFWMFKRFRIVFSRGRRRAIYLRSSSKETLSAWRYYAEVILYRVFGALPFVSLGLKEIDDV